MIPQTLAAWVRRLACKFFSHDVDEDVDWPTFTSWQVRERGRCRCRRCGCGMKKQILKEWEKVGVHQAERHVSYRWVEWPVEEQVAEALMEEPRMSGEWQAPVAPPNRSVLR